MEIYKILAKIMEERQLKIADVARICNLPDSTVRGIETRKQSKIALDIAFKLSEGLGVSLEYLNGMPEKTTVQNIKENELSKYSGIVEKYHFISKYSPDGIETVNYILNREHKIAEQIKEGKISNNVEYAHASSIPSRTIQYFQSVSTETGQVIFDDVYSERITISDIPEYRRVAYAVKVSGNSMELLYNDGDMLLIEPACSIDVGEIGIYNIDGQAYIKKLGQTELISLNTRCKNIALTTDSKCMGRVVARIIYQIVN